MCNNRVDCMLCIRMWSVGWGAVLGMWHRLWCGAVWRSLRFACVQFSFDVQFSSVQSNRVQDGGRALDSPLVSKIATLLINCACRISCNCAWKRIVCVLNRDREREREGSCAVLMCMWRWALIPFNLYIANGANRWRVFGGMSCYLITSTVSIKIR